MDSPRHPAMQSEPRHPIADEAWLRDEIIGVWGEHGAHAEVFASLLRERDELREAMRVLAHQSIEAYAAQQKPQAEWDEYDHVVLPAWRTLLSRLTPPTTQAVPHE